MLYLDLKVWQKFIKFCRKIVRKGKIVFCKMDDNLTILSAICENLRKILRNNLINVIMGINVSKLK